MSFRKTIALVAGLVLTVGVALFTGGSTSHAEVSWPPRLGEPFPDLSLVDQTGETVAMSSFAGKVILVEYVGMNCPGCQAFAGGHDRGGFGKVRPQARIESIDELLPRYGGGVSIDDERLVYVQILLYSMSMGAPSAEDARAWARHFRRERAKNHVVLAGTKELLGDASYNLIPGFHLVDKSFVVRSDSAGHKPRENLYSVLLPMVAKLLAEAPPASSRSTAAARAPRGARGKRWRDLPSLADEPTVAAAYRAIPHRRTVFDARAMRTSARESEYLDAFFRLVDSAMVERVHMAQWIASGGRQGRIASQYERILEAFAELEPPASLREAQKLVIAAIEEQRAFLKEWQATGETKLPRGHPRVRRSSGQLVRAYQILMKTFPKEGQRNKQAFFDYLCALDFV